MNKHFLKYSFYIIAFLMSNSQLMYAQNQERWTLEQAVESAMQNNNLVHIKALQSQEQDAKIKEAEIKKYPVFNVTGSYQYNVNVGQLSMPAGSFGTLPLGNAPIALPAQDMSFELGNHNVYNAGAMAYQPITQLGKIKTGIDLAKTEKNIAMLEQSKVQLQIKNGVEQLYYGILAVRKRMTEAEKNIEVAKLKLYDVENALSSGKTISTNTAGLNANIANEEQELLKLKFQEEDYVADFRKLTGITSSKLILEDVVVSPVGSASMERYISQTETGNIDRQLSDLQVQKSELGIKAARQSNLPEIGILGGYTWQQGNVIFPEHNPYVGINLKWNIQDIFTNKQVAAQRNIVRQQAIENKEHIIKETTVSTEKSYRKLRQAAELIQVAEKAVSYRQQELKVEQDKRDAGLNNPVDVLQVEADLAKAEADLYGAKMSYKVAESELSLLTAGGIQK